MKRFWKNILGIGLAALGLQASLVQGQAAWPVRPITVLIPSGPGGGLDNHGRAFSDAMSKELGQPMVLDFKPGAGGTLAAGMLARAPADGYTVLITTTAPLYSAPFLFSKLPYDAGKDFAFISRLTDGGLILVTTKDVPANSMKELVAWIKQQGRGKVDYGSYGVGTTGHMLTAFFNEHQDLGMTHVPYKAEAPLLQDMLSGRVPIGVVSVSASMPHYASGRIKPIAVFGSQRAQPLPDVPTVAESGFSEPEYNYSGGLILVAPAGTPPQALAKLETAARNAANLPYVRNKLLSEGTGVAGSTATELRKHFETSLPSVERLVKVSGAKVD
jgi:tripartite-type tricarboxylate transporter receptor subunit TctC